MKIFPKSLSVLLALSVAIVLGGCTPDQERSPATSTATESAVTDSAGAKAEVVAGAGTPLRYLKLESSSIDLCKHPSGLMSAQVSWDASALPADGVQIWLQSPGEARKLWTAAAAKGSERTGEWLQNGTKVILVAGHGDSTFEEAAVVSQTACAG